MMPYLVSELQQLSDHELHQQTIENSKKEQQTALSVLYHLKEVERRKLYATKSYASLWEYAVKALGYSESQASERIKAMQFMARIPEAQEALKAGRLKMTQAAMTERALRQEEKETQTPRSNKEVTRLMTEVQGKSKRETEKILLSFQTQDSSKVPEKIRSVTEAISELRFPISGETRQSIERFWELKGRCSVSELFSTCLTFYLTQKDPLKTQESENPKGKATPIEPPKPRSLFPEKVKRRSRYIPRSVKREVLQRSGGRCEYRDIETNRRCESRFLVQYDHITPYALGGGSDLSNI